MATKYLVLDVSKYQGNIDWKTLAATGLKGVIIRCAYRGYGKAGTLVVDPKFNEYVAGAIKYGIPYGVYFFSQAITKDEAVEEAKMALELVKKQSVQPLYPIYIDTEWGNVLHTGRADKLTKYNRTQIVKQFCSTVEKAGYYAGIYASTSWYANQLEDQLLTDYTHWVAHYATKCGYKGNHDMWQYTSSYSVKGISRPVDANWCYKDFPSIIQKVGLNGYKGMGYKLHTVETVRAVSEYALDKFKKLAAELDINLTVTEEVKYFVRTEPITEGDVNQFKALAGSFYEDVNIEEV